MKQKVVCMKSNGTFKVNQKYDYEYLSEDQFYMVFGKNNEIGFYNIENFFKYFIIVD